MSGDTLLLAEVEEVGKVVGLGKEAAVKGGVELAC